MKFNYNIENLDPLLNNLLDDVGKVIVDESKRIVPTKTGNLRESIEVLDKDYTNKKVIVGSNGKNGVIYSLFIELGTIKMKAQPYLRPSLDNIINLLKFRK